MTISFTAARSTQARTTGGTTLSVDVSTVTSGKAAIIWVAVANGTTADPGAITLSAGTKHDEFTETSSPAARIAVFWWIGDGSTSSLTASWTGTGRAVAHVLEYDGVNTSGPLSGTGGGAQAGSSSTSAPTGSLAAGSSTYWALAGFYNRQTSSGNKNTTFTADGALTERTDSNNSAAASSPWIAMEVADGNAAIGNTSSHSFTATASFANSHTGGLLTYLVPSSSSTNASAGVATATGAAQTAAGSVSPHAGAGAGTGTGQTARAAVQATAGAGTGTGAAYNPSSSTGATASAGVATATGAAQTPAGSVAAQAGAGAGTAAAQTAAGSVAPHAGAGTGTAAGQTATGGPPPVAAVSSSNVASFDLGPFTPPGDCVMWLVARAGRGNHTDPYSWTVTDDSGTLPAWSIDDTSSPSPSSGSLFAREMAVAHVAVTGGAPSNITVTVNAWGTANVGAYAVAVFFTPPSTTLAQPAGFADTDPGHSVTPALSSASTGLTYVVGFSEDNTSSVSWASLESGWFDIGEVTSGYYGLVVGKAPPGDVSGSTTVDFTGGDPVTAAGAILDLSSAAVSAAAGVATATGAGQAAAGSVAPTAGAGAGTGAGLDATVTTGSAVNAAAGVATATAAAGAAAGSVAPGAGAGAGTGSGAGGAGQVAASGGAATATAAAQTPAGSVAPTAGSGAATGAAADATVSTSAQANASAGVATATGAALDPAGSVAPAPGAASAVAAAGAPAGSVAATAGAGAATGAGAAPGPGVAAGPGPGTATGAGQTPAGSVAPHAGVGTGAGAAVDATVSTTAQTNASAGVATATGTGAGPAVSISTTAGTAAGTGAAADPAGTPGQTATAGVATATAVASSAAGSVAPTAGAGTATGAAADALGTTPNQVAADVAQADAAAHDASIVITATPRVGNSNGWAALNAIIRDSIEELVREASVPPTECPVDGTALQVTIDGRLYCPFDGWTPDDTPTSRFYGTRPPVPWQDDRFPEDPRWGN